MKTKEELMFRERETVGEILDDNRRVRDIEFVIAEVLIDMRDLMVDVDKSLNSIKDSLKYMEHRRTNIGPR